jgi:hypothetical protein
LTSLAAVRNVRGLFSEGVIMNTRGYGLARCAVEVELANNRDLQLAATGDLPVDQVRRLHMRGVTGIKACLPVIPEAVVRRLGLTTTGQAKVHLPTGGWAVRDVVAQVSLEVLGRRGTYTTVVEPTREDVLIGLIVLEDLDLLVDPAIHALRPRDPNRMLAEIE